MNVHRVVPDPQKWIQFYKSALGGKQTRRIQRGRGGTLTPKPKSQGRIVSVRDVVVTPAEQAVQQAKAEIQRRQYKKRNNHLKPLRQGFVTEGTRALKRKVSSRKKKSTITKKKNRTQKPRNPFD